MGPTHPKRGITRGWQRTWAPIPLGQHLPPPDPSPPHPHPSCVLCSSQPHMRSKPWRMELELSSPVTSEGHRSSAGHKGIERGASHAGTDTHAPPPRHTLPGAQPSVLMPADTPLEPGGGTNYLLRTSLSPPTRRHWPPPSCHSPWRADLAHMLLAQASAHWAPRSWLRQPHARSSQPRRLACCLGLPRASGITLLLQHHFWDCLLHPGPGRGHQDPGEWSLIAETLEKGTVAQVISDGVPVASHTVNCAKTCHVERLLRSLPRS